MARKQKKHDPASAPERGAASEDETMSGSEPIEGPPPGNPPNPGDLTPPPPPTEDPDPIVETGLVKMWPLPGFGGSINLGGTIYEPADDGCVYVPAEFVEEAKSHLLTDVDPAS